MERNTRAAWTWAAAVIPGLAGSLMFYNTLTGANYATFGLAFPLFMLVVIIATLAAARLTGIQPAPRTLWLLIPVLFFAAMVAVRAETLMIWLNISAALALGGLALHYLPLRTYPDQDSTLQHMAAITAAGFSAAFGALVEAIWLGDWLRSRKWEMSGTPLAVVRGLVLAVPVLLIFGVLLASADEVFSKSLDSLLGIFALDGLDGLAGRLFLLGVFTWGAAGMIAWGVRHIQVAEPAAVPEAPADETPETPLRKQPAGFRLGMIESGIILGSVIGLFAVFVLIQFKYLFGGLTMIAEGMTYANYARRGFFELVAVTVLVLTLGRVLDAITARRSHAQNGVFRGMCVLITGLTLVILGSAWHRMFLYEEAYGFTHLRLYTHVFMLALAALLGFFLLEVFRVRRAIFSLGILLVTIGYLVILNAMNVELFIAERNIERYRQGKELDICYLHTFSVDALPAMLALVEAGEQREDAEVENMVNDWMSDRYRRVFYYEDRLTLFELNLSEEQARQRLSEIAQQRSLTGADSSAGGICGYRFFD